MKKYFGLLIYMFSLVSSVWAQHSTDKSEVFSCMEKVANWQIQNFKYNEQGSPGYLHDYGLNSWTNSVFYIGLLNWAETSTDQNYINWLLNLGEKSRWTPDSNFKGIKSYGLYHADELCVGQFYIGMNRLFPERSLLDSSRVRMDEIMANRPVQKMNAWNKQKWTWCDALFMAPALYSGMSDLSGDTKYLDYMHEEFMDTYRYLYNKKDSLFYRDDSYFSKREKNGKNIYWGRGNGWVVAGIAQILKTLPEDSSYRPFYEGLLRQMLHRLLALQDEKGFWHASLLDPESYPAPESSATALIMYAMAYGLNNEILEREIFLPAVQSSWEALKSVMSADGKLGFVQPIGANPNQVTRDMTAVYGTGAFLLAGSELYKMSSDIRQTINFGRDWEFRKVIPGSETEWERISVPHTWNNIDMQTKNNDFFAGEAHYKKTFVPDLAMEGKRIFIRFEGIASVAEIYLNGKFAGNHAGGFSAYCTEITRLIKPREKNELLVKVNNSSDPAVIPVNHKLFGVYGGIYRPVQLIATSRINISLTDHASSGIYITQNRISQQSADISLKIKLENPGGKKDNIEVRTSILEKGGKLKAYRSDSVCLSPQGRQALMQEIHLIRPHLWQGIEDPYLYKVRVTLTKDGRILDEKEQALGLREFELRSGQGMYLNGKKVPMYGVCRHQDRWKLGSALTKGNHDQDLALIKELGATTIRLAHYQQSDYFYSKCDSLGFLVWAEIPFVNKATTREAGNARQQLTELIRQNYNHPSIYIWGLGNEVYSPSNYVVSLFRELNDLAKSEDPNRYTVQVSGYNRIDQEVNNNADIQGINQYFGWYNGTLDSMKTWVERVEKQFPEHKVIFSEYGAEGNIDLQKENVSNRGDCCGFKNDYNESFATRFHEEHWKVISEHPYLLASYIWNMFDFATPMSSQGQVYARNMKGLVTFDRKIKKDPFYWYKANWSKEAVLYITQRRVVNRSKKITPVTVYSNQGVPELRVNGRKISSFTKGLTDVHFIFQDIRLRKGKNILQASCTRNGKKYTDQVIWYYSEDHDQEQSDPEIRQNEHIGL